MWLAVEIKIEKEKEYYALGRHPVPITFIPLAEVKCQGPIILWQQEEKYKQLEDVCFKHSCSKSFHGDFASLLWDQECKPETALLITSNSCSLR